MEKLSEMISVSFSKKQKDALEKIAKIDDRPLSSVVRKATLEFIRKELPKVVAEKGPAEKSQST